MVKVVSLPLGASSKLWLVGLVLCEVPHWVPQWIPHTKTNGWTGDRAEISLSLRLPVTYVDGNHNTMVAFRRLRSDAAKYEGFVKNWLTHCCPALVVILGRNNPWLRDILLGESDRCIFKNRDCVLYLTPGNPINAAPTPIRRRGNQGSSSVRSLLLRFRVSIIFSPGGGRAGGRSGAGAWKIILVGLFRFRSFRAGYFGLWRTHLLFPPLAHSLFLCRLRSISWFIFGESRK